MLKDENGEYIRHGCVTVPITIKYEDSWVVEERAGRKISTDSLDYLLPSFDFMESIVRIEKQGETGTVSINTYVEYVIENTVQTGGFFNSAYFDSTPKVNASFEYANISDVCKYDINSRTVESVPKHSVGIQFITLDSPDDEAEFSDVVMTGNSAGTSSTGESWACDYVYEGWSGVITTGGGGWAYDYTEEGEAVIPKIYKVRMYWDNKIVEEFVLMEVK